MASRFLLVAVTVSLNVLGAGQQVANDHSANPGDKARDSDKRKRTVPPTHVIIDAPIPTLTTHQEPATRQGDTADKPLPMFLRPEWVSVFVTVVYSVIAGWTLIAIRKQANLMQTQEALLRDTAKRQLRAYVCVDSAMLRFTGTGNAESFEVQVDIRNSGQTPAYDLQQWSHVWIEEYPLRVELPEPSQDFQMASTLIAPGGRSIMVSSPGQPILAPIITLGNPSRTIYAYGKVCYKDAFGDSHTTRYRFFYGGSEPPRRKTHAEGFVAGVLQSDTHGNQAD